MLLSASTKNTGGKPYNASSTHASQFSQSLALRERAAYWLVRGNVPNNLKDRLGHHRARTGELTHERLRIP